MSFSSRLGDPRYMSLETIAPLSNDPFVKLVAVP